MQQKTLRFASLRYARAASLARKARGSRLLATASRGFAACAFGAPARCACGRGPGPRPPLRGAPRPSVARALSVPGSQSVCGRLRAGPSSLGFSGPLFAHSAFCRRGAPAPRLVRSGAAAPPPALAAPVRRLAARASLAGAGPRAFPPAPALGLCAPLARLRGTRWPRFLVRAAPSFAGLRFAGLWPPPLSLRGFPRSRVPAGSPLARPLCGFGPGGLLGPGLWRPLAAFFRPLPRASFCARARLRALRFFARGFSPAAPPRPCRPRRGLAGSAELVFCPALFAVQLCAAAPLAPWAVRLFRPFDSPKIVNQSRRRSFPSPHYTGQSRGKPLRARRALDFAR